MNYTEMHLQHKGNHKKFDKMEADRKRYFNHKRFAALSILTCGNSKNIGFGNVGHRDNDFIDQISLHLSIQVLR